jgi:hypothetical protein
MKEVVYIQVFENKAKELIPVLTKELTESGIRPYFQIVPCNGVMVSASSIDQWLTEFVELMMKKNIMVSIQSGKPTPPPCPPGGCIGG